MYIGSCCRYLEFHRMCKLQVGVTPAECGANAAFVARFAVLHWLPTYLVAVLTAMVGCTTMMSCVQDSANGTTKEDPAVPLEGLGIALMQRLGLRKPLLAYHRVVIRFAAVTQKLHLLGLVSLLIACYYTIALVLARNHSNVSVGQGWCTRPCRIWHSMAMFAW